MQLPEQGTLNIAHSATIRVFCGEGENEHAILAGLQWLLPFDIEKEKITIQGQNALGFNDKKITIFEVALTKNRHVRAFLDNLVAKISEHDKQTLLRQLDSRVDEDANFFLRFEKERLSEHHDLLLTDGGNCYHIKIKIASFPSTKEAAIKAVRNMLQAGQPQTI